MDASAVIASNAVRIRRFFSSKVISRDDVDDLYQEAVLAIIEGYPRFRGDCPISAWVCGVCRNVYRSYVSRRERYRKISRRLEREPRVLREDPLWLRLIVDDLPEVYRDVYLYYYARGLTVRETAALMGRPEGTVKYLLYDLRRRMKALIE